MRGPGRAGSVGARGGGGARAPRRDTPYYSLELHMHLQMLISPLRVLTANEADIVYARAPPPLPVHVRVPVPIRAFAAAPSAAHTARPGRRRYVPFYATQIQYGLGGEGACKPNWTRPAMDALIAQFWADAPALLPLLGAKPHWMQLSEIEWMIHHGCGEDGWGLPLACHPLAAHMVFATPESMTEPHPVAGHQRFASGRPAANNTVTIPYLGHVHRASMQQRAKLLADERVGAKKAYVASMCFRSMRGTQLRADLARQCDARADECLNVGNDASLPNIIGSYRRAWFCVQPYGDSPTRSAIMDCIASGLAVPAVFDEFLFDMLPFADVINYRAIVAYIPAEAAMAPGASFLDWLRHYDGAARAAMLGSLQAVSQALQYAVRAPPRAEMRIPQPWRWRLSQPCSPRAQLQTERLR